MQGFLVSVKSSNVQSFAERMISAGKLRMRNKRGLLEDNLASKLTVLRMNRIFIEFARENKRAKLTYIRGVADRKDEDIKKRL